MNANTLHMLAALEAKRRNHESRNLPVSFRELRANARDYRAQGWEPHDSARLALDHAAPYHELFRSH